MTRMTTVTTNDYQDDGQCKDDWWRQYTCCASCTAEPGEEEPAEEQRWHFHISDDLGDQKSHDGGDKKMVTGSARLVVTLKTEALSLHSWWQKIFGQQNKKTDPFSKKNIVIKVRLSLHLLSLNPISYPLWTWQSWHFQFIHLFLGNSVVWSLNEISPS